MPGLGVHIAKPTIREATAEDCSSTRRLSFDLRLQQTSRLQESLAIAPEEKVASGESNSRNAFVEMFGTDIFHEHGRPAFGVPLPPWSPRAEISVVEHGTRIVISQKFPGFSTVFRTSSSSSYAYWASHADPSFPAVYGIFFRSPNYPMERSRCRPTTKLLMTPYF